MTVTELGKQPSVLNHFIAELRDVNTQSDRMRFRRNLERTGELLAYEISKDFDFESALITTPLGQAPTELLREQPVLLTILRAGLPFHQGFLNYFDRAPSAFVSAFRKHKNNSDDFVVEVEYLSTPDLEGKVVVLNDPMLATGSSIVRVYRALLKHGTPRQLVVACVLATEEGIAHLKSNLPANTRLYAAVVDTELTAHGYIVPGLGDAGDLAYGPKQ